MFLKNQLLICLFVCSCLACGDASTPASPSSGPPATSPLDPALSDDRPVDMLFRASVTLGETDCDPQPVISRVIVDVMHLSYEMVNISFGDGWTLGPQSYTQVLRHGSRIDYDVNTRIAPNKIVLTHFMRGIVDPDHIDLDLVVQDIAWDVPNGRACTRHAHVAGTPRPLLDPQALDGRYEVYELNSVIQCNGTPVQGTGASTFGSLEVDADSQASQMYLKFDDTFVVTLPDFDTNGQSSMTNETIPLITSQGITLFTGDASAVWLSDLVITLHVEIRQSTDPCPQVVDLKANKVIPSLTRVSDRYRVHATGMDECAGKQVTYDQSLEILMTPQGDSLFWDQIGTDPVWSSYDSQVFQTSFTSGNGSTVTSYYGTLHPGSLSYISVIEGYGSDGKRCATTLHATGVPRFIF